MAKILTDQQILVVNKLLEGKENLDIASELNITRRCVQYHKRSIKKITNSKSILQAVARIANRMEAKLEWR